MKKLQLLLTYKYFLGVPSNSKLNIITKIYLQNIQTTVGKTKYHVNYYEFLQKAKTRTCYTKITDFN